jgi:hypothetical protein
LGSSTGTAIPNLSTVVRRKEAETAGKCQHCLDAELTLAVWSYVFEFFGFVRDSDSDVTLASEFEFIHLLSETGNLLAYCKYKCADVFAWAVGCERPEPLRLVIMGLNHDASGWVVLGGAYYRFAMRIKREMRNSEDHFRRGLSFFYSFLMSKKGLPRPSPVMVKMAETEARKVMTTPAIRRFSDHLDIQNVTMYARCVVQHLFGGKDWTKEEACWPSISSHMGSNTNNAGALGALRRAGIVPNKEKFVLEEVYDTFWVVEGTDTWAEEWDVYPHLDHILFTHLSHMYRRSLSEDYRIDGDSRHYCVLSSAAADELVSLQYDILRAAIVEPADCKPVGLPEPLKIRIVTTGPPLMYTALKPVQKWLWSTLKADKRFAIGAPITRDYVNRVLGKLLVGNKWLSGDYKAATDNLAIELSYFIAKEIADVAKMPRCYEELFIRALVGHDYVLEEDDGKFLKRAPQARGQLMGSPVSFPILCIANFAIIWSAIAPCDDKWVWDNVDQRYTNDSILSTKQSFKDLKCIVNGDDCLFQTDQVGYDRWAQIAKGVGMSPSVGKTYFSDEIMVINSMLFADKTDNDIDFPTVDIEEVPYVNLGLMMGLKRSGRGADVVEVSKNGWQVDSGVGGRAHALIKGFGPLAKRKLMKDFIIFNDRFLKPHGPRPYSVPSEWGGYGLPTLGEVKPSPEDMAAVVAMDMRLIDSNLRPIRPPSEAKLDIASPFFKHANNLLKNRFGTKFTRSKAQALGALQWTSINLTYNKCEGGFDHRGKCMKLHTCSLCDDTESFYDQIYHEDGTTTDVFKCECVCKCRPTSFGHRRQYRPPIEMGDMDHRDLKDFYKSLAKIGRFWCKIHKILPRVQELLKERGLTLEEEYNRLLQEGPQMEIPDVEWAQLAPSSWLGLSVEQLNEVYQHSINSW